MAAIMCQWYDKHEDENKNIKNEGLEQQKEPVSLITSLSHQNKPAIVGL